MLTWQDFDTVAPMFDEGSALAIDTRRYDAFGYPYGEGVMSAEFVLAADDVKGCTVPKAEGSGRRLGYSSASCFIFQGMATFACKGKTDWDHFSKYGQNSNVAESKQDYAEDSHTSMLFGKFDFSEFGTPTYGSAVSQRPCYRPWGDHCHNHCHFNTTYLKSCIFVCTVMNLQCL